MHDKIKRALISVSNKENIVEFATFLHEHDVTLIASAGTAELLRSHHLPVEEVADFTGFPEILQGRVKTLHPKILGGILARPHHPQDQTDLQQHEIATIDLVIVNLYPFRQVCESGTHHEQIIENIDIGGVTLLRAAAKNYHSVTVAIEPADYLLIQQAISQAGIPDVNTRLHLASKAFQHIALYDTLIAAYFAKKANTTERLDANLAVTLSMQQPLRYGENPHQQAAFYTLAGNAATGFAKCQQLQGKSLSYNNLLDANTAYSCVNRLADKPSCVIVKHANPCGVAQADDIKQAYLSAWAADSTSAYGGIIAFNRILDEHTVATLLEKQFAELIIAPAITPAATTLLAAKPNLIVLVMPEWQIDAYSIQKIAGGVLLQTHPQDATVHYRIVSQRTPTATELNDLLFAWHVVEYVKSNAIVIARATQTLGIGAGQTSRIDAVFLAQHKAQQQQHSLLAAVLASDGFFPFTDNIELANQMGITAIIQPYGSIRDNDIIASANAAGMALVFTETRAFRH